MTTSMLCLICRSSDEVVGQVDDLAVDPRPHDSPARRELGEEVLVFPLLAADDGRQDAGRRSRRAGLEDPRDDLLAGLRGDRPAAVRAVPLADPGEEHPQVVVDLGDRADGAIAGCGRRSSAGSRSTGSARRSGRPGAWASARGTAGHSSRGSRRTAAGPRHRACRTPASSSPSPLTPGEADQLPRGRSARRRGGCARAHPDHDVRRGHPWLVLLRLKESSPIDRDGTG